MNKKVNVLIGIALVCGCELFAQEQQEEAPVVVQQNAQASAQQPAVVENDLEQNIEIKEFIIKEGPVETLKKMAKDAKLKKKPGAFISIKSSDILDAPRSRKYVTKRIAAFASADVAARQDVAKHIKQSISGAVEKASQGATELKADDFGGNEALKDMVNDAIRKELEAKGVDLTDTEAIKKAMPKITQSDSFKRSIDTQVQGFVVGVSTYASISSDTQVAVLAYSSNTLREIAKNIVTGTEKKYPSGEDIEDYVERITPQAMANMYGLRVKINEEGEPCLVAFAQWPVTGSEDAATESAEEEASMMIREFVGMAILANSGQSLSMQKVYMQDADNPEPQGLADASAEFKRECVAATEKVDFSGIDEADSGIIVLPSGDKLAYYVAYWTPSKAKAAAAAFVEGQQLQQTINKQGAAGAVPTVKDDKKVIVPEKPVQNKRKDKGAGGVGVTGDAL